VRLGGRTIVGALAIAAALLLPTTALGTSAMPGTPPQAQANLPDIESQVMCPVCGTALNLSFSPQADRERAFIRKELAQGKTESEIIDDLVAQYGTAVLAEPPKSGFDLTAWLVPGIAIILAAIGIGFGLRRWRRAGRTREAEEASMNGNKPLDETERERLDSDLARYDL
jgi:cytochrome c-type biogenesis protein CcmH